MKLIAVEEHFLTQDVATAWAGLSPEERDPGLDLHSADLEATHP